MNIHQQQADTQLPSKTIVLNINRDETVLTALLRHGVAIDYQCKQGYCGTCRTYVRGTTEYQEKPLALIQQGEVLVCCAYAKSDLQIVNNRSLTRINLQLTKDHSYESI